jgi:hypothetical protein
MACTLNDRWLSVVPLICLILMFVLSLFTWHTATVEVVDFGKLPPDTSKIKPSDVALALSDNPKVTPAASLWGLAFIIPYYGFMAYTILMLFPVGPLIVAGFVLDKGLAPPQVDAFLPWKSLATALLLGLTYLFLLFDCLGSRLAAVNPVTLAEEFAGIFHFLAMLASFGMFWLHLRKMRNLPLPRLEIRW